ncbi:MAG: hypothetical protein RI897_1407 [Verrucomicrobiota bacterium]|jgi:hypothetical protein
MLVLFGLSGTGLVAADLQVREDAVAGCWTIFEGEQPVLVYRYKTQEPPAGFLAEVHPDNLKYARERSDYIHPLYSLSGQVLTRDWPVDHPHHRGIYWAWPEVEYDGVSGDLHALQRVFARPAGQCHGRVAPESAWLEARNHWLWDDKIPVVLETARIRVWQQKDDGRAIDLEFTLEALVGGVTLARRETTLYGGLNLRFASIEQQEIFRYTGPDAGSLRETWADIAGVFPGAEGEEGVTILQHPDNPDYPGDWVEYPELNWVQPTFPQSGRRYALMQGEPLVLRYRLWLHRRRFGEEDLRRVWRSYLATVPPLVRH